MDLPRNLWQILGDPTQLHQVLLNLCVNARDAMPDGGLLTLSAENLMLDDCFAKMMPEAKAGSHVVIQVQDTGTGIAPEIVDKIFDPFFTTKKPDTGTGLGLATVLSIVRSHNGFIQVDSQLNKGTKFKIYLPAAPAAAACSNDKKKIALPRGNGELILVVDDEACIRILTRQLLEKSGYRVLLARDGTEATSLFAQNMETIQLVLTDLIMPIMDGYATISVLRGLKPRIKIIAASGAASKSKLEQDVASLPVQAFLPKPFTAEVLLTTVQQVLREPDLTQAAN